MNDNVIPSARERVRGMQWVEGFAAAQGSVIHNGCCHVKLSFDSGKTKQAHAEVRGTEVDSMPCIRKRSRGCLAALADHGIDRNKDQGLH